jgi:hypothetical protein
MPFCLLQLIYVPWVMPLARLVMRCALVKALCANEFYFIAA